MSPIIYPEFRLYDPHAVQALLDTGGSLISEEQRNYYAKMIVAGGTRKLRLPTETDRFRTLDEECPNFHAVTGEIRGALTLARIEDRPLRLPPILLLGKPSIGKTHYARTVTEVLGLDFSYISMSSATASWIIGGGHPTWQNAGAGKVSRTLIEQRFANPWFLIDEIDKVSAEAKYDPLGSLYELFEPDTAGMFSDEFVGIPCDASYCNWFATANDERDISLPILKRMLVMEIPDPNPAQMRVIARNLYLQISADYPKSRFDEQLSEAVLQRLAELTPRDIRMVLRSAFGTAAAEKRQYLNPNDIRLVGQRGRRVGF